MTRYRFAWCWFIGCCVLAAIPAAAQPGTEGEPIPVEEEEEEAPPVPPIDIEIPTTATEEGISPSQEPEPSRISLAGWCVLRGEREQPPDQTAEGEGEDVGQQAAEEQKELGCDAGGAFALIGKDFRQGRLSLVGVLGVRSLGIGGAWTFGRQGGHPLSVAVGLVAPYDSSGIYSGEWEIALGATIAVFGRR